MAGEAAADRDGRCGDRDIVVVASAFGTDVVRRVGHAGVLPALAGGDVAGFEVRRELFAGEDDVLGELPMLQAAIADMGLYAVFSTPDSFFDAHGAVDLTTIARALDEARTLGARLVKLQMGRPAPGWEVSLGALVDMLSASVSESDSTSRAIRLVVENGQMPAGGVLADALAAFAPWRGPRGPFGMTFDVGNWRWTGVEPLDAATALREHVDYIHVKGVAGEGARRFAVAPPPDDVGLRAIIAALPPHVPLGIEFPLLPDGSAQGQRSGDSRALPMPRGAVAAARTDGMRVDAANIDDEWLDAFAGAVRHHARWLTAM